MTFKELQKIVHSQSGPEHNELLQGLRDKPFWIWNQKQHKHEDIKTKGECCFNQIIGLPIKDKVEKPLFDYEKILYDSLLVPDFYNPSKHPDSPQSFERSNCESHSDRLLQAVIQRSRTLQQSSRWMDVNGNAILTKCSFKELSPTIRI